MKSYLLLCAFALALQGCASTAPAPADDTVINAAFQRPAPGSLVVILPPKAETNDYGKANGFVTEQLRAQLVAAGYKVKGLDATNHDLIWAQEVAIVGGIYDPATGQRRGDAYARAVSALAQRVATDTGAALVVWPGLVLRQAIFNGTSAEWDGQRRTPKLTKAFADDYRMKGSTIAISVELLAVSSNGQVAFKTLGGVSLPYSADVWHGQHTLRDDLFSSDEEIGQGIAIALRPLLAR